jgi:hypothetical protein
VDGAGEGYQEEDIDPGKDSFKLFSAGFIRSLANSDPVFDIFLVDFLGISVDERDLIVGNLR